MTYAEVAIAVPLKRLFTYKIPCGIDNVLVGSRVCVPFHRRIAVGYVINLTNQIKFEPDIQIKDIISILDDEPPFAPKMVELLKWIADYYCAPIGEVCKMALPVALTRSTKRSEEH